MLIQQWTWANTPKVLCGNPKYRSRLGEAFFFYIMPIRKITRRQSVHYFFSLSRSTNTIVLQVNFFQEVLTNAFIQVFLLQLVSRLQQVKTLTTWAWDPWNPYKEEGENWHDNIVLWTPYLCSDVHTHTEQQQQ